MSLFTKFVNVKLNIARMRTARREGRQGNKRRTRDTWKERKKQIENVGVALCT
jgi:hypothetical protein